LFSRWTTRPYRVPSPTLFICRIGAFFLRSTVKLDKKKMNTERGLGGTLSLRRRGSWRAERPGGQAAKSNRRRLMDYIYSSASKVYRFLEMYSLDTSWQGFHYFNINLKIEGAFSCCQDISIFKLPTYFFLFPSKFPEIFNRGQVLPFSISYNEDFLYLFFIFFYFNQALSLSFF